MVRILTFLIFCSPTEANAKSIFDPKDYIYQESLEQSKSGEVTFGKFKVKQTEVRDNGIDYVKYKVGNNALYIQKIYEDDKSEPLTDQAIVECAITKSSSGKKFQTIKTKHRVRIERQVTEKMSIDLGVVGTILYKACSGTPAGYEFKSEPIILGVSWETTVKRQKRVYRVFNQGFGPNLGFSVDF